MISMNKLKLKLVVIPLITLLIIISLLSILIINITKNSLIKQMSCDGINLGKQIVKQLEKNQESLNVINTSIDNKIKNMGNFISNHPSKINNHYLIKLTKTFHIDKINISDKHGTIIYSNSASTIGTVFNKKHIAYPLLSGEKKELLVDSPHSSQTENYYRYGYFSKKDGGIIQIGISSSKINKLKTILSAQTTVENLAKDENIVFSFIMDKDLQCIASDIPSDIGQKFDNFEQNKTAITTGKINSEIYFSKFFNKHIFDVLIPIYQDNEVTGLLDIGLSLDNFYSTVKHSIIMIIIIAILSFIIIGTILFFVSNSIVDGIHATSSYLESISQGDLSISLSDKYLNYTDEIGILARSMNIMKNSIKSMLENIKNTSENIHINSKNLSVVSEEMKTSSEHVTNAIQTIVNKTDTQAKDLVDINCILGVFNKDFEEIIHSITDIDSSSHEVHTMTNKSSDSMCNMEKSIDKLTYSFEDLASKISVVAQKVNQINEINVFLNTIVDKINLLALNAAIEAAIAGESGKGFAVVADEVKNLAEQAKSSYQNIEQLITTISTDTDTMIQTSTIVESELTNQKSSIHTTINLFKEIIHEVDQINPKIQAVNELTLKINDNKNSIIEKVETSSNSAEEISSSIQEITASAEEMNASSQNVASSTYTLDKMTKEMTDKIGQFHL